MRLQGRTAIITGAGSGIGRASAKLFAEEGARLALVDRDSAGLQETLNLVGEATMHIGDVGDAGFAETVVGDVVARLGRLDILMTAAGFSCGGTVLTTDPADWDAVFRTNVGGTWLWARAAVPQMQRQKSGSIITLASQLAIAGGKGNSAYIAAKGAIVSLTRTMAVDFATDGIRVNAIAPGYFLSDMSRQFIDSNPELGEGWRSRIPAGRLGEPPDLRGLVVFLASDASCYVVGESVVIDGGYTLV